MSPRWYALRATAVQQLMTEFDYLREANALERVSTNIMPHFGEEVVVPRPVMELCTRDVVVRAPTAVRERVGNWFCCTR